jgi:hypothetical protein
VTSVPDLSVVLATPLGYATLAKTMAHLRAQTARRGLEIVIVAISREPMDAPAAELAGFWGYQLLTVEPTASTGEARAAGIHRSNAAVVALAEDHSYPVPDWAEALIAAHRGPWAAVGPAVRNANPDSMISRAGLLMNWTPWIWPCRGGVVGGLPWHSSAYKRDILMRYGSELGPLLDLEVLLHRDLGTRGHQLYLEPAALTAHENISRPTVFLHEQLLSGRLFAAARARRGGWSPLRRLVYCGGAPLIPAVQLWRIWRERQRAGDGADALAGVLPALLAGVVAHSFGELVGYGFGARTALRGKRENLEFDRRRFLTDRDRRLVAASGVG